MINNWVRHLRGLADLESSIGRRVAFEASADKIEALERENKQLKQHKLELMAKVKRLRHFGKLAIRSGGTLGLRLALDETPQQSLAEHDADVVDRACDYCEQRANEEQYYTIDPIQLREYANQLRQQADKQ